MVSSQERICLGFLKNGENLRKVGGKEGFCCDKRSGRGRMAQGGLPAMCRLQLQQGAIAAEREGAVGMHIGACGTALSRNDQVSLKGKAMCVACLGDDSDHR